VYADSTGRQAPGDITIRWDGKDLNGNMLPDGEYQIVANVDSFGEVKQVPITTPVQIKSVTYSAEDGDLILEVTNGDTVRLSQVKRIEG
jgi:flagellar basal-body rod modification protein FlgD